MFPATSGVGVSGLTALTAGGQVQCAVAPQSSLGLGQGLLSRPGQGGAAGGLRA